MTMRDLGRRLSRLEEAVPAERGKRIDSATLNDVHLEALARVPRLPDGDIDFSSATSDDLRVIANIKDLDS